MIRPRYRTIGAIALVALLLIVVSTLAFRSAPFEKLPEAAPDEAKSFAVVFDFDGDSCYPAPAVSGTGQVNGGLKPTGGITGECRNAAQLDNSNTYYRKASIKKGNDEYAVHMYALYFQKDQFMPVRGGHRHDWEFALVWTKNGQVTHASVSAHGGVTTLPKEQLHFDKGQETHVKVVYHKDDVKTHAFRFAKPDEPPENHKKQWLTPTIVAWDLMKGDGVSNEQLRQTFNAHDFGDANCSFNDGNFPGEISKRPPDGYPPAEEWRAAAAK